MRKLRASVRFYDPDNDEPRPPRRSRDRDRLRKILLVIGVLIILYALSHSSR